MARDMALLPWVDLVSTFDAESRRSTAMPIHTGPGGLRGSHDVFHPTWNEIRFSIGAERGSSP
jgi:hypothetical protein